MNPRNANHHDQNLINSESNYFTMENFNSKFKPQPTSNQYDSNTNIKRNNELYTRSLSLLHINARSLNKNFDSIELLLSSLQNFPFSIIGISETWLHTNSPPLFNIENYQMLRSDRGHGKGGGVALYTHNAIIKA